MYGSACAVCDKCTRRVFVFLSSHSDGRVSDGSAREIIYLSIELTRQGRKKKHERFHETVVDALRCAGSVRSSAKVTFPNCILIKSVNGIILNVERVIKYNVVSTQTV